ncbi:MAG: hypothetical protein MK171_02760 [Pirellulales bacterium]|nr:hypothetical protein [Pirellulales bacterium]
MCNRNIFDGFALVLGFVPVAIFLQTACTTAQGPAQPPVSEPQVDRFAVLEKSLSGVALVGHFVATGGEEETKLKQERYELKNVRHLGDDLWLFLASIRYGDHDVTLPLTMPIRWAGDTPVITVDEMTIPGLGTYTARVMIYADHYAGFWSGGDHGGHLFGTIARSGPAQEAPESR